MLGHVLASGGKGRRLLGHAAEAGQALAPVAKVLASQEVRLYQWLIERAR